MKEIDNINRLKNQLEKSLSEIDKSEKALVDIPLSEDYKDTLSQILRDIKQTLLTTEPILKYVDEVRELILYPVQVGIENSFKESNKWGIRGIVIAIVSLIITAFTGIGGLIYSYCNDTNNYFERERIYDLCYGPKIKSLLIKEKISNNNDTIFVFGDCLFRDYRVTIGGIDVKYEWIDNNLLKLIELPLVTRSVILKIEDQKYLSERTGKLEYGLYLESPEINTLKDSISINKVKANQLKSILTNNKRFSLGQSSLTEEMNNVHGIEKEFIFNYTESELEKFIEICYIGDLPDNERNRTYLSPSRLQINDSQYNFSDFYICDYKSYFGYTECCFIIPLAKEDFKEKMNVAKFIAGQYKQKPNSRVELSLEKKVDVQLENFIIKSFEIFEKQL